MHPEVSRRRQYGSGSVYVKRGSWYGQWRPYPGAKQVNRALGKRRAPGRREGLTRKQAEARLRTLMSEVRHAAPDERLTLAEAGARYLHHLTGLGRKRSTLMDYESTLRVHLAPYFGRAAVDRIGPAHVEAFIAAKAREGRAPKSVLNYVGLLHSIFEHAQRRGWATGNPCKLVDKPSLPDDYEIRFLDTAELEALLRAVPDDRLGPTEATLYLTAAMTGLRQGELVALRWLDVDWLAARLRVRRNYVRGEYGTPKTLRSTRSVPLADRVGAALEAHSRRSRYQADDDLVFCHPDTGRPLDRSKLLKRFKAALTVAGARPITFHGLRHTFGTRMAAAGVPMRTLQEWMGHRDFKTTLRYADYAPSAHEAEQVNRAFAQAGTNLGTNLSTNGSKTEQQKPL